MTPEEFRKVGHQLVDWVADYRERVSSFPVMSRSAPGDVKARLAVLENRRKVVDQKEGNKPSLRRTSSPDKSGKDTKNDDDRPTLKRRPDSQDQ